MKHYGLALDYDPESDVLFGRAAVFARATQKLRSFNLVLRPFLEVERVRVNGKVASFTREGEHELVISPPPKLKSENAGGSVTTADFIALAERESGQQLHEFFQIWLSTDGRPELGTW